MNKYIIFQFAGYFLRFNPANDNAFNNALKDIENHKIQWVKLGSSMVNKSNILYLEIKG